MKTTKHTLTTDAPAHPISNGMNTKKILAFIASLAILSSMTVVVGTSMVFAEGDTEPGAIEIRIPNPFAHGDTVQGLFRAIIDNVVLPIGGVLAVMAFIFSGFLYVMAQGNPEKIKKAHNALLYTAIGTAILLGAWVISNVITTTIKQLQ